MAAPDSATASWCEPNHCVLETALEHRAAVRMHAAFRIAGCAGRVRHDAQVVRSDRERPRLALLRQHLAPCHHAFADDLAARRRHELRHPEVGRTLQVIGIRRHHDVAQPWPSSGSTCAYRSCGAKMVLAPVSLT